MCKAHWPSAIQWFWVVRTFVLLPGLARLGVGGDMLSITRYGAFCLIEPMDISVWPRFIWILFLFSKTMQTKLILVFLWFTFHDWTMASRKTTAIALGSWHKKHNLTVCNFNQYPEVHEKAHYLLWTIPQTAVANTYYTAALFSSFSLRMEMTLSSFSVVHSVLFLCIVNFQLRCHSLPWVEKRIF